ncbi:MAG: hypothetical protein IMF09_08850 [Proteobacteria bacterium]|nr:hypothetical protein [Pseudomonadota bacterium]
MNDQQQKEPGMGYKVVPSTMGKLWLQEAWQYFRSRTRSLVFSVLLLMLLMSLASVPVLGMVISILSPVFTAGLLLGIRAGFREQTNRINLLDAWQKPEARKQLVLVGFVFMLVGLLFSTLAGPDLAEFQLALLSGEELALASFSKVIMVFLAAVTIISLSTWLAIPEIAFRESPALVSLLLSLRATLANWRALSMLGLWLILIGFVAIFIFTAVTAVLLSVLGTSPLAGFIVTLPVFALMLAVMAVMYVLQYLCWRDILADPDMEKSKEQATTQLPDQGDNEQTRVII